MENINLEIKVSDARVVEHALRVYHLNNIADTPNIANAALDIASEIRTLLKSKEGIK